MDGTCKESLVSVNTQVRTMPSRILILLGDMMILTVKSSFSMFLFEFYLKTSIISLRIIFAGIGWSVVTSSFLAPKLLVTTDHSLINQYFAQESRGPGQHVLA